MKHIFYINRLETLNLRKDSSLFMMHTFKLQGHKVYALFEEDLYLSNDVGLKYRLWEFKAEFEKQSFYLKSFQCTQSVLENIEDSDVIHMRIDPPYDARYQRYLWMLDFFKKQKVRVVNDPIGIMMYNEKMTAYRQNDYSVSSYVGSSQDGLKQYLGHVVSRGVTELVIKPLDFFSGIGVMKCSVKMDDVLFHFNKMTAEYGCVVVQPFMSEVYKGEFRSIFFKGVELGTIIKYPQTGNFISNIAQGASFEKAQLSSHLKMKCEDLAWTLKESGVDLIAFDLLGKAITEVNITCPGLLVEVSHAVGENIALAIADSYSI
jgi:glutathione synthase